MCSEVKKSLLFGLFKYFQPLMLKICGSLENKLKEHDGFFASTTTFFEVFALLQFTFYSLPQFRLI